MICIFFRREHFQFFQIFLLVFPNIPDEDIFSVLDNLHDKCVKVKDNFRRLYPNSKPYLSIHLEDI